MLLRLIFGGQEVLEKDHNSGCEDTIRNKVLSLAQDMVYGVSGGRKWTPKHIGLGSTLHQATRSKHLVDLFHKAGHCLSYQQILQVDTALAEHTLKSLDSDSGAVIPPGLVESNFIHYTADNIDILDETLDGKNTFHATQMAAWQRGQSSDNDDTLKSIESTSIHTLTCANCPSENTLCEHKSANEPDFKTQIDTS